MSSQEYVKYMTKRFVQYLETPKEERRRQRELPREPWSSKWFGAIPMSIKLLFKK
ncbi:YqzE family protein [Brevibacillus laterosporus]|uniref:YqzE family protein n=1 Tax=Brevibacillus laterosporus TaxID=1465 RepID=A0AAP3DJK8_BRELA|nr:YqzE family protein [Brevibacillus laterosporus]MCR8981055.1 YqzE family protein [Brevibacillus laterosporus]MCZ0808210.1 YqzE family protein [Brevibacillus laterosporus]MCZ0826569.1 YqzE family protein [Brevibacillus laterosporus]MCZ0850382.1 YqzE family protein [Brevibacillus laterosporus]